MHHRFSSADCMTGDKTVRWKVIALYLVLLGTIQDGLTGGMNTTLDFHSTSTVEIVATEMEV